MSVLARKQEIEYPSSDGQPMAETPQHAQVMHDLIFGLKAWYEKVSDIWVGGNLFLYYEEGDPTARVAPDLLVAKGVRKWDRPNYQVWQEGPPVLAVEVTSKKTRRRDQVVKKPLYERLGIKECVLFDPLAEYLRPSLQGFRLIRGIYQPIPLETDGSLRSQTTGLWFRREGQRLRLVDVATGERLLWDEEERAARVAAEAKAAEEIVARQAAEMKAAEESAARQAAEARAASEAARAAEESAARQAAEERIRALEAELERLREG